MKLLARKILSLLLSLLMILVCVLPMSAFGYNLSGNSELINDTDLQKDILSDAVDDWNDVFIKSNSNIPTSNDVANKNKREYLIVKTIYDFTVRNTTYDSDAYIEYFNGVTDDYVHSAYAAFFGNIDGARTATSYDDIKAKYNWSTINNGNLVEIDQSNQGKAVCDGYSALFYILCKSNGIDCMTVRGTKKTYVESLKKEVKDDHEWNYVFLCDNESGQYEWFQVDTTYAASSSIKDTAYTNYYYFLRGRENIYFTDKTDHQNIFTTADSDNLNHYNYPVDTVSPNDYDFSKYGSSLSTYSQKGNDYIAIIMKPTTGSTSYTDSLLIRKNDNDTYSYYHYVIDENGMPKYNDDGSRQTVELADNSIDYKGPNKIVYMLIPGFIYGGEYDTVTDEAPSEPGEHTVKAVSKDGSSYSISRDYKVNRIDMANNTNNTTVKGVDDNNCVEYSYSANVEVKVAVVDGYGDDVSNSNYVIEYVDENNNVYTSIPTEPGKYDIQIDFNLSNRYRGIVRCNKSFTITKLNIASWKVGNANSLIYNGNDQITPVIVANNNFEYGKDYTVEYINCSPVNASSGSYRVVALDSSKYLTGATNEALIVINKKSIENTDVAFYYSNLTDTCANVALSYNSMALVEGRDYTKSVISTPTLTTLTVSGIGNYTGTRVIQQGKTVVNYVTPTVTNVPSASTSTTVNIIYPKPKSTSISKLTKGKKQFKVTWKKLSNVTGYQIQYSTSKKFTKKTTKTVTVKGAKSTSKTVKKLKGNKKYYVRVRVYSKYKLSSGGTTTKYSSYSKVKTVTTKK